ncbi:MAG: DUF1194 domain-containing protein [Hyphomicrobiales bacterium]|nr:DUF1194 domain-containing protein [Hyphomicrobiales bacterium]
MLRRNDKVSILVGIAALAFAAGLPSGAFAQSRIPVSIELVLAVDTSLSVDDVEYDLQMTGIANAFRDPNILALIAQHAGVAVTLFQWSTNIDAQHMVGWHLLTSPQSTLSFAAKIERLERDPVEGFTAIGKAIDFGVRLIVDNKFDGRQLRIDVSGDGRNNSGVLPVVSKRGARAHNITINGLPILIDTFNLDTYFREKVIEGPGAFIEIATDYEDFTQAFLRKLTRELTPTVSGPVPLPKPTRRQANIGPDLDDTLLAIGPTGRDPPVAEGRQVEGLVSAIEDEL